VNALRYGTIRKGWCLTASIDFHAAFNQANAPFMIVDRELVLVDMNEAYLREVGCKREDVVGRPLFEAFPETGEPRRLVEESLHRALRHGETDHLPLIPYAIRNANGDLEARYWSATHTPLLDEAGEVAFVLQHTQDVTDVHRLRLMEQTPLQPGSRLDADIWRRAEAVQHQNDVLQVQQDRMREMFMQAPGFIAVLSGPDHRFELANHAYGRLVGHRDKIGAPVAEALPEVVAQGFIDLLDRVRETGEPYIGRGAKVMLRRQPDAEMEERFIDFIYQPMTNEAGQVTGVFVQGSDVTEGVRAQEQERLLINELNHRVKNTLATVQAIASQTLRQGMDPAAFAAAFQARVTALSQTHNILTDTQWQGANLRKLLEQELSPYDPGSVILAGEDVRLAPRTALSLGLVFHELSTNAAKYGALSQPGGQVRVSWTTEPTAGGCILQLEWSESGGPAAGPPTRRGFGSRLVERSIRGELDGELHQAFRTEGLTCTIKIPLEAQA
jgi:PAS domain S-box-containing protein